MRTCSDHGSCRPPGPLGRYWPKAGQPLARPVPGRGATPRTRCRDRPPGDDLRGPGATTRRAAWTGWRPRGPARSGRRCRSARRPRRTGPAGPAGPAVPRAVGRADRSLAARVARARCRALLTDATVVSSRSATSLACQRSTSPRISTARWRGGRCWSAATKASRIDSRPRPPRRGRRRPAGPGGGHGLDPEGLGQDAGRAGRRPRRTGPGPSAGPGAGRPRSMSRQTLVAMRYSQERRADRPSKRSKFRHARTMVSCTASSASKAEPSMR